MELSGKKGDLATRLGRVSTDRNPTGLKTGPQPAIEQSVGKQFSKPTIQLRTYLSNLISKTLIATYFLEYTEILFKRRVIKMAAAMDVGKWRNIGPKRQN
ncbi:hypothetical protein OUZ56_021775 [Daphnia magna]|uniref:Uncharacterized protein n=1 Tax=Daphnia magna TaxID=35525 RepID=A0ABR0AUF5_9CRUS|nr:hypothetical protein OUZ56_021775 [Daphnia magna]